MFLPDWFRPKPKFEPGQIVRIDGNFSGPERFMVIQSRRWARPIYDEQKQWVYGGQVFIIVDNKPVSVTCDYRFMEFALAPIFRFSGTSARLRKD